MTQPPYPSQPGSGAPYGAYPPRQPDSAPPSQYGGRPPAPQYGGYPSGPQQQGGYPSAPQQGGYPSGPQQQGGYPSAPQQGGYPSGPQQQGGYPSAPQQGGYPSAPQQQGGYPSAPQYGGYPPAGYQQPVGYPPSSPGGYSSAPEPGGYPSAPDSGGYPSGPQAGGPGQPYGTPAFTPAPKKRSTGKVLLIVLLAVLVLCGGGAAVAVALVGGEVKDAVDTATKTRVVAPETLAGRPKVTDPNLLDIARQLETTLNKSLPGATSTVGAFYGTPAKKDLVMVAAASGPNADPGKTLNDTIAGAKQSAVEVGPMTDVEAGPLGGEAKCGDAKAAEVNIGLCIWSDRGSVGMIMIYFKSGAQVADELVAMRGQIEQQG
ncbi:hypothetical protein [Micromonospora sp. NPDC049799]|uniref:hypothetical protein n=1 Tax=Micromonospora sp. NPDC049799 TaxID=3154741 RepID=UPI0033E46727